MSRRKQIDDSLFSDLVPHPRYGASSVGEWVRASFQDAAFVYGWPVQDGSIIFPQSVIRSDSSKMASHGAIPPDLYVDTLRQCIDCNRHFIFFAREQQHWYEELGFFAGEGGRRCYECRRARQLLARCRKAYADFANGFPTAFTDISDFLSATLALWEAEELVDEQKLRRIVKLAKAEAPTAEVTMQLVAIVERLNSQPRTDD